MRKAAYCAVVTFDRTSRGAIAAFLVTRIEQSEIAAQTENRNVEKFPNLKCIYKNCVIDSVDLGDDGAWRYCMKKTAIYLILSACVVSSMAGCTLEEPIAVGDQCDAAYVQLNSGATIARGADARYDYYLD